jgi:glycerate 2-kinase
MTTGHAYLSAMRADAEGIFRAGIDAAAPGDAVRRHCRRQGNTLQAGQRFYDLNDFDRIVVVGAGKASATMAQAVEELLADRISQGLVCVKYGHDVPLKHVAIIEAGHPLPDKNGLEAARRILEMVRQAGRRDLVIVLLSGGGSALLPLPSGDISLADKQAVSDLLLGCGATIQEINTLRKHVSEIKGGRLAQSAAPATLLTLIISDVVGDDLDVIASGPTVPDRSTFQECLDIVSRYGLKDRLPGTVLAHLHAGVFGKIAETPKATTYPWDHVYNLMVANNFEALASAAREARARGYQPLILSSSMEGETRTVAQVHSAIAREIASSGHPVQPPACLLSGGETTVTLKGSGKGGRNQEFVLAATFGIRENDPIVVLSGGTDGTDGPTDAAGAIADGGTLGRAYRHGLNAMEFLNNNDAYTFFSALGDLLITGPTRTNVMDLRIVLIGPKGEGASAATETPVSIV